MKQKPLISKGNPSTPSDKEMVSALESKGYLIIAPESQADKISNLNLIRLYYTKLNNHYKDQGLIITVDPAQEKQDQLALQRFHSKALSLKHTKGEINKYLVEGISLLFECATEVGIYPPKTFQLLVSRNHGWIFSKVAEYQKQKKRQGMEKYLESVYNQDDEALLKLRDEREKKILGEDI